MKNRIGITLLLVSVLAIIVAAVSIPATLAKSDKVRVLEFDVSEDMSRFVFDQDVAFEDGMPAHGSTFVTQGYIYEAGTLTDSNGTLPDGSPEFPDKVIGQWTCRGVFVGDGAHAESGAWVITTQLLNFGGMLGVNTLVTEGYEIADFNQLITRAITGGTGEYANARGEGHQELLGFNASEGVNLRFSLEISQ